MASKEALEPLPLFPSGKHLKFPFRQNKASSLASIILGNSNLHHIS